MEGLGSTGKPDLPCVTVGEPPSADGATSEHATYIVSLESNMTNTGSLFRDAKESGQ